MNVYLINKDYSNHVVRILNEWHDTVKIATFLFWLDVDHWVKFLLALLNNPFLCIIMKFTSNQAHHLRDTIILICLMLEKVG